MILEAARTLVTKQQIEDIVDSTAKSVCFVKPVVDTLILRDKTYSNRQDCLHLVSHMRLISSYYTTLILTVILARFAQMKLD